MYTIESMFEYTKTHQKTKLQTQIDSSHNNNIDYKRLIQAVYGDMPLKEFEKINGQEPFINMTHEGLYLLISSAVIRLRDKINFVGTIQKNPSYEKFFDSDLDESHKENLKLITRLAERPMHEQFEKFEEMEERFKRLMEYLNSRAPSRFGPLLHQAVRMNDSILIEFLIDTESAGVNRRNDDYTPLELAAMDNRIDTMRLLLKDERTKIIVGDISALNRAVSNPDALRCFLELEDIDVNFISIGLDSFTVLMSAVFNKRTEATKILLDDPRVDPTITNSGNESALSLAKKHAPDLVQLIENKISNWGAEHPKQHNKTKKCVMM